MILKESRNQFKKTSDVVSQNNVETKNCAVSVLCLLSLWHAFLDTKQRLCELKNMFCSFFLTKQSPHTIYSTHIRRTPFWVGHVDDVSPRKLIIETIWILVPFLWKNGCQLVAGWSFQVADYVFWLFMSKTMSNVSNKMSKKVLDWPKPNLREM